MNWNVFTLTALTSGSSSMATATALDRSIAANGAGLLTTGWEVNADLSIGAASGTYNTFATGGFAQETPWLWGVSWVPTGGTAPNIITAADDSQFLFVAHTDNGFDRNTINTAGSPAYKDSLIWRFKHKGRTQLPTGSGGNFHWHIGNTQTVTVLVQWEAMVRITYAQS